MTLRHMRILLAIVQGGSMAAAARELYLSQPALSLAVKEMEDYYGVMLFDRLGRGLRPTQEGRAMALYARQILTLFEDMETSLRNTGAQGALQVGASITVGNCLMPQWARAFEQNYPQARLTVRVDDSQALTEAVAGGDLDLAVVEGVVSDRALICHLVARDELVPVCAPHHPLADGKPCPLALFAQQDMLAREMGSAVRALMDNAFLQAGLSPRIKWQSSSTQALVQAAAQGLGVALLPGRLARPHLDQGIVKPLQVEGLNLRRNFTLIHHKNKYLGPAIKAFMVIALNSQ